MSDSNHTSIFSRKMLMGVALLLLIMTAFAVTNHFTPFFNASDNPDYTVHYEPLPPTQEEPVETDESLFTIVEQMPELKGGIASIANRIVYPQIAKSAGIEGRVFVQFVVEKDGSVSNAKVVRGIGGGCDEEAIRAVSQAVFIPGKQRGTEVRVKMTLPVMFKLS